MTQTATIERVPTKPPCYRLIIWKYEEIKRLRKVYLSGVERNCEYWYRTPEVEEYTETVSTINAVFETSISNYNTLRRMTKDRGFIFPTHSFVNIALLKALGPADHDAGFHHGVIVHEWIALDDEREQKYKLSIHPRKDARWGKLELYNQETGETRVIG